ncbi:penicillin-binding protein 2 [Candidatus Parcubacteria bacterium]|nr:MAG: penicillin-binding protein 2 [Candidatus Parcubacteria bacterium]
MARLSIALGILASAYAFLLFRLYDVQLVKGSDYLAQAESRFVSPDFLKAARGTIYLTDKDGNKLPASTNKHFPLIYAVPKVIEDPTEAAHRIGPIVGQSAEELEKKFLKNGDEYELILRKADSKLARTVSDLGIKGIYVHTVPERFYPHGPLASHLLGFVAPDESDEGEEGRYGVEEFFNDILSGNKGKVENRKIVAPSAGSDVILTVDPNVQIEAARVLANLVKKYKANGGTVIIGDPKTGKILALTSVPDFDPNQYNKAPLSSFINPVTQQIYEPGSVFKVITMAAGIDSGSITPETTYVDTGTLTMNGRTIQNHDFRTHGPYGRVTMTNVIEHSLNTGAVFAERQMGRDIFKSYLEKFGLGEKTGVTLPGELKGDIRRLNPKERDIIFATASYGQGVAVTPIGLITAVGAIANGGKLMSPYLDASLEPVLLREVIREDTARKVTAMMVSAVDKADVARIEGYSLAGKTGTAFVPDFVRGGYTENVINTYVGFGPASDPRFIVLVRLNEPESAPFASLTVVPAFRELAQFMLNYYEIPPDRL